MLDVVPSAQSVFYGTDDYAAGARLTGTDARWLRRCTRRQLRSADLVLATSPVLARKWSAYRPDIEMVPNGCEAEHFATADRAPLPRTFTCRARSPASSDICRSESIWRCSRRSRRPASRCCSSAHARRRSRSRSSTVCSPCPNVQWVGPKDFQELPSYLRVIDVGLTPYSQSDFNRASFPLKTLEYLAAGRPVVASDLPANRWLDTPHVSIAGTPREFAERTVSLLRAGRSEREASARRALGARHSWAARTEEIRRLLGLSGEAPASRRSPRSLQPQKS